MAVGSGLISVSSGPLVSATITVQDIIVTQTPHSLVLSSQDSQVGWSVAQSTITLSPTAEQTRPVWYQFELELADEGFTFIGIQIYPIANANNAAVFLPGFGTSMIINLLDNFPPGDGSVSLGLAIGVLDSNDEPHWIPDPTIIFDAPPSNPIEE